MRIRNSVIVVLVSLLVAGCWDEIKHRYDEYTHDLDTELPDGGIDSGVDGGNDDEPKGWDILGRPCTTDEDCKGYSERARCLAKNIMGIINVPGGYCTACCDKAGEHCADGVQCIGLDKVYLICAAQCETDADCRQDEGYICTTLDAYVDTSLFPGTFCMPDNEHSEPDPKDEPSDPHCDWPWVKK